MNLAPKEDVAYLAIDPGDTSGWAQFDSTGKVIAYGQFHMRNIANSLQTLVHIGLQGVIVEDYKNHPWAKQRSWDRNNTSKIIGQIEMICGLREIPMVLQPNTVKAIGYKWAGLDEAPSNHSISHQFDAIAHGVYWLQKNGIRKEGQAIASQEENLSETESS